MKILTPPSSTNYRLLDSGDNFKLEQFGSNIIIRSDSNCIWKPHFPSDQWNKASAIFATPQEHASLQEESTNQKAGNSTKKCWLQKKNFKEPWIFSYHLPPSSPKKKGETISLHLRLSQSKNIGAFPEQAANWEWMTKLIHTVPYTPRILNLFAYTGGATLCSASAGAEVCHVDASKAAISWAKQNQQLSNLNQAPIRWIVDDCTKFVTREINRKVTYDALIIDPPAFGRNQKGKIFEFEKRIYELLELCVKVLKPKPLFVLFNGYSMGYSATVLKNLLTDFFTKQTIEFGELQINEFKGNYNLPCSIFARFENT